MSQFRCLVVSAEESVLYNVCGALGREFERELKVRRAHCGRQHVSQILSTEAQMPNILVYHCQERGFSELYRMAEKVGDVFDERNVRYSHTYFVGQEPAFDTRGETWMLADRAWGITGATILSACNPDWCDILIEHLRKHVLPELAQLN